MANHDWKNSEHAKEWDTKGHSRNPLREKQLDVLLSILEDAYQPNQWVLDLGFGSGQVEKLMFDRIPAARVVGVDSSLEMIGLAAERLTAYEDRYQSIEHDLNNLDTLLLPEHSYQFIIAEQIVLDRGDLPVNLESHLQWLKETGFSAACLHLHGNRELIAARKKQ